MFEEFVSELRNLEMSQDIRFPINIPLDDNGYFDRACPHSECRENFKVLFDDWRDKVPEKLHFVPNAAQKTTRSNSTQNPRTNLFKKLPMHMQWRNLIRLWVEQREEQKLRKSPPAFLTSRWTFLTMQVQHRSFYHLPLAKSCVRISCANHVVADTRQLELDTFALLVVTIQQPRTLTKPSTRFSKSLTAWMKLVSL